MPHPKILQVLKMTPQEWGLLGLRPDGTVDETVRKAKKDEAIQMITSAKKADEQSLHSRMEQVEARLSEANPEAVSDIRRELDSLKNSVTHIQGTLANVAEQVLAVKSELKKGGGQ